MTFYWGTTPNLTAGTCTIGAFITGLLKFVIPSLDGRFAGHELHGLAQQRVAGIQHILGIVEFAGDRILDVIDELEDVTARDHAPRRHRHAAGLFDNRTQFVERFKYSVHGAPSRLRCCD